MELNFNLGYFPSEGQMWHYVLRKSAYLGALASGICLVNFVNFQESIISFLLLRGVHLGYLKPVDFTGPLSLCSGHTTDKSVLDLSRKVASFMTGTSPSQRLQLCVSLGFKRGFEEASQ